MSHTGADKTALIEFPRAQPQAKAIVHQHLHAVAAFVDEQLGMMCARLTEHIHDARQHFIYTGTHVQRFHREPGNIDADHFTNTRNSCAHSLATHAGHSMLILRPLRRTWMRIVLSERVAGRGTGMNAGAPSIITLGAVVRIAIGRPLRSAFLTQLRNMFAFRPRARATAATDTPGCWQAPTASVLNAELWRRRRRLPVSTTTRSEVDTCTPIAKVKAHPCTRSGALKDDLASRLQEVCTGDIGDCLHRSIMRHAWWIGFAGTCEVLATCR